MCGENILHQFASIIFLILKSKEQRSMSRNAQPCGQISRPHMRRYPSTHRYADILGRHRPSDCYGRRQLGLLSLCCFHFSRPVRISLLRCLAGLEQLMAQRKAFQWSRPLHLSVDYGEERLDVLHLLLTAGANRSLSDSRGRTTVVLATPRKNGVAWTGFLASGKSHRQTGHTIGCENLFSHHPGSLSCVPSGS